MEDPWMTAAKEISAKRTEEAEQRQLAADREQQKRKREQEQKEAIAESRYQAMQAAILEAIPQLERFMQERGAAAQALLEAYSDSAHIMFGAQQGGGSYSSVYLDRGGIRKERGRAGGLGGQRERGPHEATAREAVEMFATHGMGQGKPEEVRGIVSWLTKQIEDYTRR